ncbi:MAG: sigma-70 family RNA polymerase sigma factor, partial [Opitutaceae bacterium]
MADDVELLRRYVENRSEGAFTELVQRQLNLVYSVALRQVGGDGHLAEDVVQVVFTALARKAESLVRRPVLGGWLYRATQFAAIDVVRAEQRRRRREEIARAMHDVATNAGEAPDWQKLRPTLDEAIGELSDDDRDAVVLRFFHAQAFAEIGTRLEITENGARMRVERALGKLHALLARRGLTSTTTALGVALGNQIGVAAPAGLAASVSGAALAGAVNSGGVMASAGALFTMSKITVGIVTAMVATALVTGIVEFQTHRALGAELKTLRTASDDPVRLQKESRQVNTTLQKLGAKNSEVGELLRLNRRVAVLQARPDGVIESAMKPASTWSNVGRETPTAALETLHWAMFSGDLDAVASLICFDDDTPENREKFMAHFSDAVRARYPTPERLFAATLFSGGVKTGRPDDAMQII